MGNDGNISKVGASACARRIGRRSGGHDEKARPTRRDKGGGVTDVRRTRSAPSRPVDVGVWRMAVGSAVAPGLQPSTWGLAALASDDGAKILHDIIQIRPRPEGGTGGAQHGEAFGGVSH